MRSSRKLEAACADVVAFRWLAGGQSPDYRAIARFRRRHLVALGQVFVQALALCQAAGMVKLGRVALDGTKLRANASRRKAMNYARMSVDEQSHHQPRVIRRPAPALGVGRADPGQVQVLIDQLGYEPGQVVIGQPVIQRGRQQQALIRGKRPKRLVNRVFRRGRNALRPHPRLDLEQTLNAQITWHTS